MFMQEEKKSNKLLIVILTMASVVFTILVTKVDVKPIGPRNKDVGFATINKYVHDLTGKNMIWYTITDVFAIVAIGTACIIAFVGLHQWIKRKSLLKIDSSIFVVGFFYVAVLCVYILFEHVVINYRPEILDEKVGPEPSYPSSHTLLIICFMSAAIIESKQLIRNEDINRLISIASYVIIVITVVGRLISGVHWFTDIIGGSLISATMVVMLKSAMNTFCKERELEYNNDRSMI